MIILGLTGGIATGKSTVSKRLKEHYNLTIVDADIIARQVVEPGTNAYKAIVRKFGTDILLPDKTIDRPALGKAVFGNEPNRQFLNSVVHPAVRKEMLRQTIVAYFKGCDLVVLDVPLLFESKIDKFCSSSLVISCSDENQLQRLLKRDPHLSEEDANKRIASQMPMNEKCEKATYVINNDGSLEELYTQLDQLIARIRPNSLINMAEWLAPPVAAGALAFALYYFTGSRSRL